MVLMALIKWSYLEDLLVINSNDQIQSKQKLIPMYVFLGQSQIQNDQWLEYELIQCRVVILV